MPPDAIREETFQLYYHSEGGVQYSDIQGMTSEERKWHIERILEQKKTESEAIKKAQASAGAKKPSIRRPRRRR